VSGGRRQQVLLGILVAFGVVFAWNRLGPLLAPGDARGPGGDRAERRRGAAGAPVAVVELELDRLRRDPGAFTLGRDPFRYYQPPPPPPPGPTPEELEEARRRAEADRRRVEEEAKAAMNAPPEPPPIELTYLGSFGPADRRIAVFTDGDEVFNALAGDVLGEQFIVDRIGYESVDIRYVEFPDHPPARLAAGG
jgi:hypothetical protein